MNATMRLNPSYQLELSHLELMLVLKALGGRLLKDDITPARELGDHLTRVRANELERTAKNLRDAASGNEA